MVDIEVEVLATSLVGDKNNLKYKVKTIWCHVDIEKEHTSVRLPRMELIDHYLSNKDDTFIFLEVWRKNENSIEGLAKCSTRRQLQNPQLNPSLHWWEVYDPVHDVIRGKVFLRIDAKFSVESLLSPSRKSLSEAEDEGSWKLSPKPMPVSSYFSTKYTSTKVPQQDSFVCQEVQTDLSLIAFANIGSTYKNYNNATRSNLASSVSYSNKFNSVDVNAGSYNCLNDTSFTGSTNMKTTSVVKIPKVSDLKSLGDKYQATQRKKRPAFPLPLAKVASHLPAQKSTSVDNIITLLNEHGGGASTDSARNYRKGYCKSDKNHYNSSKLDEHGRQAPEGRNETDSDMITSGTSNLNSPAKSSKPKGFSLGPTTSFPHRYKGQGHLPKYSTHSADITDRPSRMAAALSFK